ncbi:MAG: DHH family phosphoesterase, partial [Lachnospiraceae bacterium]
MISNIDDYLSGIGSAAVLGHINPDGDCVGSVTALYLYIKKYFSEINVKMFMDSFKDEFPHINVLSEVHHADEPEFIPDVAFLLDTSSADRVGTAPDILKRAGRTVCIDHHVSNTGICDVNHIVPDASSASEVLFDILPEERIDKETAISIYTGIIHDSGVFQYKNTSKHT